MLNVTFSLLCIGAPVLLLGVALAFRKSMHNRRENAAPFRGYFAAVSDRDFLQHSDLSESEDWRSDLQSRFTPFRLRNPEIDELRERANRMMDRDPDSF
jgi:hypothetical protein